MSECVDLCGVLSFRTLLDLAVPRKQAHFDYWKDRLYTRTYVVHYPTLIEVITVKILQIIVEFLLYLPTSVFSLLLNS